MKKCNGLRMGRYSSVMLIAVSAQLFPTDAGTAWAQWPQWGGPNQDFKVDVKGLAPQWSESGPKQLWKRDLGEGYSAVVADGDRIYTQYRGEDKEIIVAMEAKTGKTIWEYKYDANPRDGHVHEFGDGPRSTPLVAGDYVYAIGVSSVMHCLKKDKGEVVWTHDLWTEFNGNFLNHGYSSSPVAYGETIIALVGGKEASIVAFDRKTGNVVWKKHDFENSYSTPKFIKVGGEDQMVTFMKSEIIGLDPKTGELKWQFAHGNQWGQNVCMPVWYPEKNILFFSSPEAGAKGLQLTKNGDKTDVKELWSTNKIQFYHVTAVGVGDHVYGSTGTRSPAFFCAVNIETGKIAWRQRDFAKATTLYADGRFIILDEDGQLGLVKATPEDYSVVSKAGVLDKVAWTAPTVVGKTLYVRDKKSLLALDLG